MTKPPKELDAFVDVVLGHTPRPKSKPAKKRARRAKKLQRKLEIMRRVEDDAYATPILI